MSEVGGPDISDIQDGAESSPKKLELKSQPEFIRKFSKKGSKEERDALAKQIREMRSAYFDNQSDAQDRDKELSEKLPEVEKSQIEQAARLAQTTELIAKLQPNWFMKAVNFIALSKLNQEVGRTQKVVDGLNQTHQEMILEEKDIKNDLADDTPLEDAKAMLNAFYRGERRKWETAPFAKEDITEAFQLDKVSKLSNEDYISLMRRFPSELVTHVTRQGIRDHAIGGDHTEGIGAYQDGFRQLLQDGELKSFLGVYMQEAITKKGIQELLSVLTTKFGDPEKAKILIEEMSTQDLGTTQEKWADRTAVHLAAEEVANDLYGAEQGNEIFVAFPSALIASQFYFTGNLVENVGGNHNDSWVWNKNQGEGLPIDAGFVFVPQDAQVDRTTGSKYQLDQDMRPVEITENVQNLVTVLKSPFYQQLSSDIYNAMAYNLKEDKTAKIAEFRQVMNQNGITDISIQDTLLDYSRNSKMQTIINRPSYLYDDLEAGELAKKTDEAYLEAAKAGLMSSGHLYELAKDPISSQEYWTQYFSTHPDVTPQHLVFYSGDPTQAMAEWKTANGLTLTDSRRDLGFTEESAIHDKGNPIIQVNQKKFARLAKQVLAQAA